MASNYKCHAWIRQTHTHTRTHTHTKRKKTKAFCQRERHRHDFAQAPKEARLERPQVWPWQGLARPK